MVDKNYLRSASEQNDSFDWDLLRPPKQGPTSLDPDQEKESQKGIRATDWYNEYVWYHGEEPDLRLPSDDPLKGPQYDYRNAWFRDVRPIRDPEDGQLHWPSSAGGQMLKSGSHPTFWKEGFMRRYGVNPDSLRDEDLISQYGWYS